MNTVESLDMKLAMSDQESLLKQEAPRPVYPPPYDSALPSAYNVTAQPIPSYPQSASDIPVMVQPPVNPIQVNLIGGEAMGNCNVGTKRMNVYCQACHSGVKTKIVTTHKCCTHCCCVLLALTGVLGICCCVPYCVASPESVVHNCPNCNAHIGTYYG